LTEVKNEETLISVFACKRVANTAIILLPRISRLLKLSVNIQVTHLPSS